MWLFFTRAELKTKKKKIKKMRGLMCFLRASVMSTVTGVCLTATVPSQERHAGKRFTVHVHRPCNGKRGFLKTLDDTESMYTMSRASGDNGLA